MGQGILRGAAVTAPCLTAERGSGENKRSAAACASPRNNELGARLAAAIIAPPRRITRFSDAARLNGDRFIVLPHGSILTIPSDVGSERPALPRAPFR
jgi:hypothetical protein